MEDASLHTSAVSSLFSRKPSATELLVTGLQYPRSLINSNHQIYEVLVGCNESSINQAVPSVLHLSANALKVFTLNTTYVHPPARNKSPNVLSQLGTCSQ